MREKFRWGSAFSMVGACKAEPRVHSDESTESRREDTQSRWRRGGGKARRTAQFRLDIPRQ